MDDNEIIEIHGAVKPCHCKDLEQRFHQWGRKIDLKKVRRNTIGKGGVLQWECLFQGEDAEVGFSWNQRYNNGELESHD